MHRAVVETVELLKAVGHEVVRFQLPDPVHAATLVFKVNTQRHASQSAMPDNGARFLELLSDEPEDENTRLLTLLLSVLRLFCHLSQLSLPLRKLLSKAIWKASSQMGVLSDAFVCDLSDLQRTFDLVNAYKDKVRGLIWIIA